MIRRTAPRLNLGEQMYKWSQQVKRRDPNEKVLSQGFLLLENIKRYHGYLLAGFVVAMLAAHNQLMDPKDPRLCVQDGRALVT